MKLLRSLVERCYQLKNTAEQKEQCKQYLQNPKYNVHDGLSPLIRLSDVCFKTIGTPIQHLSSAFHCSVFLFHSVAHFRETKETSHGQKRLPVAILECDSDMKLPGARAVIVTVNVHKAFSWNYVNVNYFVRVIDAIGTVHGKSANAAGFTFVSCIMVGKPLGPHHSATCFGFVHASKTSSRGASSIRERTISRPVSLFAVGLTQSKVHVLLLSGL